MLKSIIVTSQILAAVYSQSDLANSFANPVSRANSNLSVPQLVFKPFPASCKVQNIKTQFPPTPTRSGVLTVTLNCRLQTATSQAVRLTTPDTPLSEKLFFEAAQRTNQTLALAVQSTALNSVVHIISVDGRRIDYTDLVADDVAARVLELKAQGRPSSPLDLKVASVLDHAGVAFTSRLACNNHVSGGACIQVSDRQIAYSLPDQLFYLKIRQQGGQYAYGTWVEGYTFVSIQALADVPHGTGVSLSAEASEKLRRLFNSTLNIEFTGSTQNSKTIRFFDDGTHIKMFSI